MSSPADREVQAREDVERIARRFHGAFVELAPLHIGTRSLTWDETTEAQRDLTRAMVCRLLTTDVIRVGQRPVVADAMPGQIAIEVPE